MKQNYRSSKLKNPHSEFTDNKRMDWQILPTNFAIILMGFLLLMHNEHGKVAKNATNWSSGWQVAQVGWKYHTEFWLVNLLYKSIAVTARIKAWGLRQLACWDCEFE